MTSVGWTALFLITAVPLFSADREVNRRTLKDLKGILVAVGVSPEAEQVGIKESSLQADVETRLEKAGINVLKDLAPDSATLLVSVDLAPSRARKRRTYAVYVQVALLQPTTLVRDPSARISAETWFTGKLLMLEGPEVSGATQDLVETSLGRFINAFWSVNPH